MMHPEDKAAFFYAWAGASLFFELHCAGRVLPRAHMGGKNLRQHVPWRRTFDSRPL